MHKRMTMAAIGFAALAFACDRPAGEDSAADQQEEKPTLDPVGTPSPARQQGPGQPQEEQAQQDPTQQGQAQPSAAADNVRAAGELRVAELTADPNAHMNQTVVVVGEVEDMLGEHAFKLNDEAPLAAGQDDDIIVLGTQRASWTMDDTKGDARLRVEGKIHRVPVANLNRELGWEPGAKVQDEIEGEKFVLIAERVERLEGEEQQRANERGDPTGQPDEREGVRGEDEPAAPAPR
jgi:hypothetical protein